ncbi:hypothetical protein PCAR4_390003 [Paraburkholderia caribensis]|nr:hypothetical protein PCAR4_390003 [Paraburkholderia caribensis]
MGRVHARERVKLEMQPSNMMIIMLPFVKHDDYTASRQHISVQFSEDACVTHQKRQPRSMPASWNRHPFCFANTDFPGSASAKS